LFKNIYGYTGAGHTVNDYALFNLAQSGSAMNITNCTFYVTTVTSNGLFYYFASGSSSVVKNNIIYASSSCPIATGISGTFTFNNNDTYNGTSIPSGSNNITSDPKFIDPVNDNFNLKPSSPCRNTGI